MRIKQAAASEKRARLGQAMLLSILILTAITLVGLGFVSFIVRTLRVGQRSAEAIRAVSLARAGINEADRNLLTSAEGSDWRPIVEQDWNGDGAIDSAPPANPDDLSNDWAAQFDEFERSQGWHNPDDVRQGGNADGNINNDAWFVKRGVRLRKSGDRLEAIESYLIKVQYLDPNFTYNDPLDNRHRGDLKLTCIGRVGGYNSRVYRKIVAYKPLPLIQFLRFVTNTQETARLGIEPIDFDSDGQLSNLERDASITSFNDPNNPTVAGSVRINSNLEWVGANRFNVRSNSVDDLRVAGLISQPGATISVYKDGVLVGDAQDSSSPSFDVFFVANIPRYRDRADLNGNGVPDFLEQGDVSSNSLRARSVSSLQPPSLGGTELKRYRMLTQYADPPKSLWGYYRVGGVYRGIYLDNFTDIQFKHDLNVDRDGDGKFLLKDWRLPPDAELSRNDPNSGWAYLHDSNPAYDLDRNRFHDPMRYVPPGAKIVFGGTVATPQVTITRHDYREDVTPPPYLRKSFRDENTGQLTNIYTFTFDYDRNGLVIFAEGNVRVRAVNGIVYGAATVVSMGSIYIEGPLLSSSQGGRLVLLAKDCVCLNTTAMLPQIVRVARLSDGAALHLQTPHDMRDAGNTHQDENDYHLRTPTADDWEITWQPVLPFNAAPNANARLYVRHSGVDEPNPLQDWAEVTYEADGNSLGAFTIPDSNFTPDGSPANHALQFSNILNIASFSQIRVSPSGTPPPNSQRVPYRLFRWKFQLLDNNQKPLSPVFEPVTIEAAVLAERGCWYVLPTPFFDISQTGLNAEFARRFNYFDIKFKGTITEFSPAPPDDVKKWTDKLAYPVFSGLTLTDWETIEYEFDPNLMAATRTLPVGGQAPSVPYLPASPELTIASIGR